MTRADFLDELADRLQGPRRQRKRLIDELSAHIEDAVNAELATATYRHEAERNVVDRLGGPDAIAARWNAHQRALRETRRHRLAAVTLAVVAAAALGVTQYAAGKPQPPGPPRICAKPKQDPNPSAVEHLPSDSQTRCR